MPSLSILRLAAACLALLWASAQAQSSSPAAVVRAFHDALRTGDVARVQQLLAPDAVILEGGQVGSREEDLRHHLAADIAFAKAVPSRPLTSRTTVDGATAWVASTSVSEGSFQDRRIDARGAELIVLTRTASSWRIRAVHWSSQ